ncbi:MAG: hypothetical protein AAF434_15065 [Pseudomonadota bacterium]
MFASATLTAVLSIGGALGAAQADDRSVDYTLRWQPGSLQGAEGAGLAESLYTLNSVVPTFNTRLHSGDDFDILPNGITWLTRANFDHNAEAFGAEHGSDNYTLTSREYRLAYSRDFRSVSLAYERFEPGFGRNEADDVWKLGVSTGGRITSLGWVSAPLWQLSLRGQYNLSELDRDPSDNWVEQGDWYLSPSLHWSNNDTALSAGLEMPIDVLENDNAFSDEPPDYRLRANFLRRF